MNRLHEEKSPYLLQHAENPVEWYPWSDEAFERARKEDKPVFLSIGYATCHWCHVMAHESFEDQEVARLMNRAFINIKVDREERPDIDNTYMRVCQLLTGHGGWPLTLILTPDKDPFFAGTYIPKNNRFKQPGMLELIPRIETAWNEECTKIRRSVEAIRSGYNRSLQIEPGNPPSTPDLESAFRTLKKDFDPLYGGFGSAPKFPSPATLSFLIQYGLSSQNTEALGMARLTLEKMRTGGLWDQIGGGFHRYSTDREWHLPHFEKMLYDQALLIHAYLDGYLATGSPLFRRTVLEIAKYAEERLASDEGGFCSGEDADSDGEEGAYYVWEEAEIRSILPPREADLFCSLFRIEPAGNIRDEATGQLTGANVPHLARTPAEEAARQGIEADSFLRKVDEIRNQLLQQRQQRVPPLLDDKILTDWNGLMISALARAGATLEEPALIDTAEKAFAFIEQTLVRDDGTLFHRYRDQSVGIPGMADDYTCLIRAAIDLYEATFNPARLKFAVDLNRAFLSLFRDTKQGGFYFTSPDTEELLGRQKPIQDNVIPSCNSSAAMNLLRLSRLTGDTTLESVAEEVFRTFGGPLRQSPEYSPHALEALIWATTPSAEIIITGEQENPVARELIRTVRRECKVPSVLIFKTPDTAEDLATIAPYTEAFQVTTTPAAWICHHFQCEAPVQRVNELVTLLQQLSSTT